MTATTFERDLVPYLDKRSKAQIVRRIEDLTKALFEGDDCQYTWEIHNELRFTIRYAASKFCEPNHIIS